MDPKERVAMAALRSIHSGIHEHHRGYAKLQRTKTGGIQLHVFAPKDNLPAAEAAYGLQLVYKDEKSGETVTLPIFYNKIE